MSKRRKLTLDLDTTPTVFATPSGFPPSPTHASNSPSPTNSLRSMTQAEFEQYFEFSDLHGRSFSAVSDIYRIPTDNEENTRLDLQHVVFKQYRGRNYFGPVSEVLSSTRGGYQKSVLDLGCGTGLWIREMAKEFPHCEFVGVDIVPIQHHDLPENCRIEVDDINLSLEHFYGSFDLVNCRLISPGIRDYYRLIDQIGKILRPGGLVIVQEYDFRVYDADHQFLSPGTNSGPRFSWVTQYIHQVSAAVRQRGANVDAAALLKVWLRDHPAFVEVDNEDMWIPSRPYHPNPQNDAEKLMNQVGELAQKNFLSYFESVRPILLESGLSSGFVADLENNAKAELQYAGETRLKLYSRVSCSWGRTRS